jgi:hypothetical protein
MEDGGWWLVAGARLLSSQFLLTHWIIEDKLGRWWLVAGGWWLVSGY